MVVYNLWFTETSNHRAYFSSKNSFSLWYSGLNDSFYVVQNAFFLNELCLQSFHGCLLDAMVTLPGISGNMDIGLCLGYRF